MWRFDGENSSLQADLLHLASLKRRLNVVRYLVEEIGVDPEQSHNNGQTPLHATAGSSQLDVVQYLVEQAHLNPEVRTHKGNTPLHSYASAPLHTAAAYFRLDVVQYLIEQAHVKPEARCHKGRTPLVHCASAGALGDIVRYLLIRAHVNSLATDQGDCTPLQALWSTEPSQAADKVREFLQTHASLPLAVSAIVADQDQSQYTWELSGRLNPQLNNYQRSLAERTYNFLRERGYHEIHAYGILGYLSSRDVPVGKSNLALNEKEKLFCHDACAIVDHLSPSTVSRWRLHPSLVPLDTPRRLSTFLGKATL